PSGSGQFTVSMSHPSSTKTIIGYNVSGSATSGADFTSLSGTVTIPAFGTKATIDVIVKDDSILEGDETVVVTLKNILSGDTAISIGKQNNATVIIHDDDGAGLTVPDIDVNENAPDGYAHFVVVLNAAVQNGFTINYKTADSTAKAGIDYSAVSGQLHFTGNKGETDTIFVPIVNDKLVEPIRAFNLNFFGISNLSVQFTKKAVCSISDDDHLPVISGDINKDGQEDTVVLFTALDFTSKFTDLDKDQLNKIRIESLPTDGSFHLGDTAIYSGKEIAAANLGKITFTPDSNWYGSTSFKWNASDGVNWAATNRLVNINIKSVNDSPRIIKYFIRDTIAENGSSRYSILSNVLDVDHDSLSINLNILPKHGTAEMKSNDTLVYSPFKGYSGYDTCKYKVCDNGSPSLCAEGWLIILTYSTNTPPVAVNDYVEIKENSDTLKINTNLNNYDPDNNLDPLTTVIWIAPGHGNASMDKTLVKYVPDSAYTGKDTVVVRVWDKGVIPLYANDTVFILVKPVPSIGLALNASMPQLQPDDSYLITYIYKVENLGSTELSHVNISDNLAKVFPVPMYFKIISLTSDSLSLMPNSLFNGINDTILFASDVKLAARGQVNIKVQLVVYPHLKIGDFYNTAYTTALGINGDPVYDLSDNGTVPDPNKNKNANETGENDPTPVHLDDISLFIPEGFSPNGDGINDYFVIHGGEKYTINIKIFNRWGNLVYEKKDYRNEWNGLSNVSGAIGNELPEGTYFYILDFNNGNRPKAGYLTIKR
ncbi:MAG: Ig-like domain-containing protein, partial [Bacteroidota bacterium]|nr:Ig-like domain-containing protein [Bacteroidota bacterium]